MRFASVSLRCVCLLVCLACSPSEDAGPPPRDASAADAGRDTSTDTSLVDTQTAENDGAVEADAGAVVVPPSIPGQLVDRFALRVDTPPTWNSHIPKLVSDGTYLYAIVHHSPPGPTTSRRTHIMRRAVDGVEWMLAASMEGLHQPPAASFDSEGRLHLAFDCLHNAGTVQTCFQGGVSSAGIRSRAYHLVFGARSEDGALRFDTYANRDEWTLVSDGYHGIGSNSAGQTVWSFLSDGAPRILQTSTGETTGTFPGIEREGVTFLYPIHVPRGDGSVLSFVADFDSTGGTNAGYPSSSLLLTSTEGTENLLTLRPTPAVEPGTVGAFPSDLDIDPEGNVLALAYRQDEAAGTCTELLRFEDGLHTPPLVLPVGCLSNYAKLQVASDGQLFILSGGGPADSFLLVHSDDGGETWTWHSIAIDIPDAPDENYIAPTPIEARTSVAGFDADMIRFVFSGTNAEGANALYYSELSLAPWL